MGKTKLCLGLILAMLCLAGCVQAEPVIMIQTRVSTPTGVVIMPMLPTPRVITATPEPTLTPTEAPLTPISTPRPVANLGYVAGASTDGAADGLHFFVAKNLSELTDLDVRAIALPSHEALADMLCDGAVDIGWLSTPGYLVANERCGVEAVYRGIRGGTSWHRGQVIAQNEAVRWSADKAPIRTLADLSGVSLAYTMQESTSGYMLPRLLIEGAGVGLGQTIFYGGDRQAVLAVYRGEVDAAACYWLPIQQDGSPGDARALLETSLPGVYEQLDIVALTQAIPNDPLVMRADLDPGLRVSLMAGLAELAGSTEGRDLLGALYGLEGLEPAADVDYDVVREMGVALDLDWGALTD